ncbi:DUF1697 domain-containing protein [Aquimarina sp. MMG016]|uniref:DUF1697 domain-containing protein n=1 Tax=Aquimarina sp. MMG016 TaxID=2822690 RepID=UPI001B39D57C|nr:DUF1697 domain-containing protein [Aquimarina sp. MMG016]MBQ4820875.1 DUF1697 domain-containing protein [Aquimarina sp. MMG016]
MKTYIALLRGINVSGQKKIKMIDLKTMFENLGFTSVITYIQSGNVVFQSASQTTGSLSILIHKGIEDRFGFDVPVLVLTRDTLAKIHQNNPYRERLDSGEIEDKKMYFTLLSGESDASAVEELTSTSYEPEEYVITKNAVYFFAANGYGRTKLNNNFFEKKLQCTATTRNLKTVSKLLELSNL